MSITIIFWDKKNHQFVLAHQFKDSVTSDFVIVEDVWIIVCVYFFLLYYPTVL